MEYIQQNIFLLRKINDYATNIQNQMLITTKENISSKQNLSEGSMRLLSAMRIPSNPVEQKQDLRQKCFWKIN